MIYKKYIIDSMNSLPIENVLQDLTKGYVSIIIVMSQKFDNKELNYNYLTNDQIKRLEYILLLNDRKNFLISHSIVNLFYCSINNCEVINLKYIYSQYQKPYIDNEYNIQFNISHTTGCNVVAFSQNASIGIDVEYKHRDIDFLDIINNYFTIFEKNYIKQQSTRFFECWVAKEAYLKCMGCGLINGLINTEIDVIDSNHFQIINKNSHKTHVIRIEHINNTHVMGVTSVEVKNE
ncbi:4'-phosphopantetheinyl transferase family protein [Staphylococcus saccharolyticus]|uniref:4'-phosphopantetheinyl transferase family protein n=1 Tax=Staphylococcus saccharolyticus TaxID=33028 RepID=UPI00102D6BCD|nr:4'-phosphopantetheinyl transferase superfamily protein [Staphylococcus saccharolyticus]TAA91783.1 hypothetical protein DMB74_06135 [Staphylococcus saccharolyticus]TAA92631.1 hypothetical protein DMB77_09215 [Staphylococcus saccharolyticus]